MIDKKFPAFGLENQIAVTRGGHSDEQSTVSNQTSTWTTPVADVEWEGMKLEQLTA